jgi:acetyltransferase
MNGESYFLMNDSAYPRQLEKVTTTDKGMQVFLRPIRPEDAIRLVEFFESLSSESVLFRFLSPVRTLPTTLVARLTQIDYDSEVAMVAIEKIEESERFIGVGRIMKSQSSNSGAEFAIVVADSWQGKGVGAMLLEQCLEIAAGLGIREVWGTVLRENSKMLALGKKLRFRVKRVPETSMYELSKRLR